MNRTALMQQFVSGLKHRSEEVRAKTAKELNHYVTTELREVSVEELTAFMDAFNHHIFEMCSSSDVNEKKGGILAIVDRYSGYAYFFASSCRRDGFLAPLQVLVLRELAVCTPTFFYQQVQVFFDCIFTAIRDAKASIREAAVLALRAGLVVTSQRETKEMQKPLWYQQCYDEAEKGFDDTRERGINRADRIHGSLLILNELVRVSCAESERLRLEMEDIMQEQAEHEKDLYKDIELMSATAKSRRISVSRMIKHQLPAKSGAPRRSTSGTQNLLRLQQKSGYNPLAIGGIGSQKPMLFESRTCKNIITENFDHVCNQVLQQRSSKNLFVQQILLVLLPRLAAFQSRRFVSSYLSETMPYLMACVRRERERYTAFQAIGLLAVAVTADVRPYLRKIMEIIKQSLPSKDTPVKKKGVPVDPAVFTCVSMLAKAVGPKIAQDVKELLEPMMTVGLSLELAREIPDLKRFIQDGLLRMLSLILMHKPLTHPGMPKTATPQLPPSVSLSNLMETSTNDVASVTLALRTLGSFDFDGHSSTLTQFVRYCAEMYLASEHEEIRMEAVRTCSRLLSPSLHRSPSLQQLGVLISIVKQHIRNYLDDIFDLIKEYLDGETARCPETRIYRCRWNRSRLIPHMLRIFMHDTSAELAVTKRLLGALQLFGSNLDDSLHLLLPPVVKLFDTADAPIKVRRAALETIDRLTDSLNFSDYASCIVHPLAHTIDTTPELRASAMDTLSALVLQLGKKYEIFIPMVNKVLVKHRVQHTRYDVLMCRIIKSESKAVLSMSESRNSDTDSTTSEMLVNMSSTATLEDYFPAVAISTLMKIIRDTTLSQHHNMVVQAITFIFKSLGIKCVPYLQQVMPSLIIVIRSSDASFKEISDKVNQCDKISDKVNKCGKIGDKHCDNGPLPLGTSLLGERAMHCRAYAKALHYKEEEFHTGPNTQILESLISINKKLQLPEAAAGVLEYAMKNHRAELTVKESCIGFTKQDWFQRIANIHLVDTVFCALIPKLKDPDPNTAVVISVLAAVGELAQVSGIEMRKWMDELLPIIIEMLQDSSSSQRREVALWTLGQLVESTGYVVEPYKKYPTLLEVLLSFLKTEQSISIRREVIRVLGLMGALDPYKHKLNLGLIEKSESKAVLSMSESGESRNSDTADYLGHVGPVDCALRSYIQTHVILCRLEAVGLCRDEQMQQVHGFTAWHQCVAYTCRTGGWPLIIVIKEARTTLFKESDVVNDDVRQGMARMAAAAAWGLNQWESMEEYTCLIPRDTQDGAFYRAVLSMHNDQFPLAQQCIDKARDILDTELTAMAGESYSRAYGSMVSVQMLSELEEIIQYKLVPERRDAIRQMWWDRLQGCQRVVEDWQRVLQVRSLVVTPQEDMRTWLKYASLCRKSGRLGLSSKTLVTLMVVDPSRQPEDTALHTAYPHVTFAYIKHMYEKNQKEAAFRQLHHFIQTSLHSEVRQLVAPEEAEHCSEMKELLAKCYLKLGNWQENLQGITELSIPQVLAYYAAATEHDPTWYKAWHALAYMNYEAVLFYKNRGQGTPTPATALPPPVPAPAAATVVPSAAPAVAAATADKPENGADAADKPGNGAVAAAAPAASALVVSAVPKQSTASVSNAYVLTYAVPAVRGFFRSIALSSGSSLQDTLRLLTLWFDYGHWPDIYEALVEGLKTIQIETWLQMAPDYDHLTVMQKVEVFEHAVENTKGDDLAKLLWLKSPSSEVWFDRRTNYTRSLAVMSMVGYVLGLGDRHPSNLMLDRLSGKILHIDFGDCFEVAMTREKFPEKIPFRLTRMLTNAMEVTGIDGNYRMTCEKVMQVMRHNKDSVMAVLEAFVYDPLLNWRLMDAGGALKGKRSCEPKSEGSSMAGGSQERDIPGSFELEKPLQPHVADASPYYPDGGDVEQPEELNKKALSIINRVRDKLTGRDFTSEQAVDVQTQVELLIRQATSHENLCQCYIGWCPFW
ncbi:PREDICTED: serine/threonine-protein kinase mTOR-like [Priapulus caudatus]|uniref:non-specific serine/threonine protein kinase n=1 Tax=Priapulus caudatus TaxID=37621 RepID=A0ABM1DQZ9_PRICU|nr:PREDICTED: serine/threonine-protein kinase mTOR-like [Priapulus caudatus]